MHTAHICAGNKVIPGIFYCVYEGAPVLTPTGRTWVRFGNIIQGLLHMLCLARHASCVHTKRSILIIPRTLHSRRCRTAVRMANTGPAAEDVLTDATVTYEQRVTGCILGAMCGDALGASVEGWTPERIQSAHKTGLTKFKFTERGYGCYTDDTQMLLALAASLVNKRFCCAADAAKQYVLAFDPARGYGGSAVKIMLQLSSGADPSTTGQQFLPGGSFGNGGAMRIAPLGLAYRNADMETLDKAVRAALLCTHVHPLGIEGALALAVAVAEVSRLQYSPVALAGHGASVWQPLQLLCTVRQKLVGRSEEMCEKISLLENALQQTSPSDAGAVSWEQYLLTSAWQHELATAAAVGPGFQIKATDAVAAVLWAVVKHWDAPADAVVAAVHYGGDTDTLACMTGALMGALHGTSWIPNHWLDNLENGTVPPPPAETAEGTKPSTSSTFFDDAAVDALLAGAAAAGDAGINAQEAVLTTRDMGRDAAVVLAKLLAQLDCRQ